MSIPINGRIAIVEDDYNQALPLIELFGKLQFPYLYYKGDLSGLPEEGKASNDIRILFWDIFLAGDSLTSDIEKRIKSTLISIINRIISDNNYPYLLVYWSRHENDYGKIVITTFQNELKTKAPIDFLSLNKSDYFDLTGDKTPTYNDNTNDLFRRIKETVSKHPVFNYLLEWENHVHSSADNSLEGIFKINSRPDNWDTNSQFLFYKLARNYSGSNFKSLSPIEQIRNGLTALNYVFYDSLEYSLATQLNFENAQALTLTQSDNIETIFKVNRKLLFSNETSDKKSPGIVSLAKDDNGIYGGLLNSAIIRHRVFEKHHTSICDKIKDVVDEKLRKKEKNKIENDILDKFKEEIKKSWIFVETNVTPICDFVQGKEEYSRIVPGLLIKKDFKEYLDTRTEALYISPDFYLEIDNDHSRIEGIYFLLLDFKYFTSVPKNQLTERMTPILRMRQQLLAEIQSKLSRHVNRQGILFLDDSLK